MPPAGLADGMRSWSCGELARIGLDHVLAARSVPARDQDVGAVLGHGGRGGGTDAATPVPDPGISRWFQELPMAGLR